jgi:alpha-glucosidase
MPDGWAGLTVQAQDGDPDSTLNLYRRALRLRREFAGEPFAWKDAPAGCLAYRRGPVTVWLNASGAAVPRPAGDVLLASGPVGDDELAPDTAVWLRS